MVRNCKGDPYCGTCRACDALIALEDAMDAPDVAFERERAQNVRNRQNAEWRRIEAARLREWRKRDRSELKPVDVMIGEGFGYVE